MTSIYRSIGSHDDADDYYCTLYIDKKFTNDNYCINYVFRRDARWLIITHQITWLAVTEVQNESFGLSEHPCAMCRHSYFWLLDIPGLYNARHIFHRRVWYLALALHDVCAMHVFDVQASSSPPRLPFAKFRFCCDLHCWASPWRNIAYSINQSLTHPAYLKCRELKLLFWIKHGRLTVTCSRLSITNSNAITGHGKSLDH